MRVHSHLADWNLYNSQCFRSNVKDVQAPQMVSLLALQSQSLRKFYCLHRLLAMIIVRGPFHDKQTLVWAMGFLEAIFQD
jgi:hypothetical protein